MSLKEQFKTGKMVFDGAMGTQLTESGMGSGVCPEEWAVGNPDVLKRVHDRYLEAGAHTVTTSSFGGSRLKLRQYGLEDSASKINCQLATIAADAAGSHALVLGDIGPTGQFVEPLGDVTEDEMREAFSEQITALVEGGAQAVLIETMMDLTEAGLAVEAAWISSIASPSASLNSASLIWWRRSFSSARLKLAMMPRFFASSAQASVRLKPPDKATTRSTLG